MLHSSGINKGVRHGSILLHDIVCFHCSSKPKWNKTDFYICNNLSCNTVSIFLLGWSFTLLTHKNVSKIIIENNFLCLPNPNLKQRKCCGNGWSKTEKWLLTHKNNSWEALTNPRRHFWGRRSPKKPTPMMTMVIVPQMIMMSESTWYKLLPINPPTARLP